MGTLHWPQSRFSRTPFGSLAALSTLNQKANERNQESRASQLSRFSGAGKTTGPQLGEGAPSHVTPFPRPKLLPDAPSNSPAIKRGTMTKFDEINPVGACLSMSQGRWKVMEFVGRDGASYQWCVGPSGCLCFGRGTLSVSHRPCPTAPCLYCAVPLLRNDGSYTCLDHVHHPMLRCYSTQWK